MYSHTLLYLCYHPVSCSGAPAIEHALLCAKKFVQQKLLFTKRDEICVILVGSDVTKSGLNPDGTGGDFRHIETRTPVGVPKIGWIDELSALQPTDCTGDIFDGIAVALYEISARVKKLKFSKRIFVLTNAAGRYDQGLLDSLSATISNEDYGVNVIGIGFSDVDSPPEAPETGEDGWATRILADTEDPRGRDQRLNEVLFRRFCNRVNGVVLPVSSAFAGLAAMQRRTVGQTSKMRGFLDFGSVCSEKISVLTYTQTAVMKMMSRKKHSTLADAGGGGGAAAAAASGSGDDDDDEDVQLGGAAGVVNMHRQYFRLGTSADSGNDAGAAAAGGADGGVKREGSALGDGDDDDGEDAGCRFTGGELGLSDLMKAYRYGKDLVPFDDAAAAALKPQSVRALTVIRSVKRSQIPPSYLLSAADYVAAEPGNRGAALAVNALVHGLLLNNCVFLVRYVKRANSAPEYGALFPDLGVDDTCGFHFVRLPFDEDVRAYSFAALSSYPENVPDRHQLQAAESVIRGMSLVDTDPDSGEVVSQRYDPRDTVNPALARLYAALQERALDPDAPVAPCEPDDELYIAVSPDAEIEEQSAAARARLAELLPVRHVDAVDEQGRRKKQRRHWRDVQADALVNAAAAAAEVKADFALKVSDSTSGYGAGADGAGAGTGAGVVKTESGLGFDLVSSSASVTKVGTGDPAGDMRALLQRAKVMYVGDAAARTVAVARVLEEAAAVALTLADQAIGDTLFPKAVATAVAVRAAAAAHSVAAPYNTLALRIYALGQRDRTRFGPLWELLRARGREAALLSSDEAADSTVSAEDALAFLTEGPRGLPAAEEAPAAAPAAAPTGGDEVDFDDLE
jgi:hypothetical protein